LSLVFAVCCVGSGLCDSMFTHSEHPSRFVSLIVCDVENSKQGTLGLLQAVVPQKKMVFMISFNITAYVKSENFEVVWA